MKLEPGLNCPVFDPDTMANLLGPEFCAKLLAEAVDYKRKNPRKPRKPYTRKKDMK